MDMLNVLSEVFNKIYDDFYENGYNDELVNEFDDLCKSNNYFRILVGLFVDKRHDFISSDREAAAFIQAVHNVYSDLFKER